MSRIVLGITGSVAALRTPTLYEALRSEGHEIRIVATEPALRFFEPAEVGGFAQDGGPIYRDADEWPAARWNRDDPIPHIDFRRWADGLLVAPLDANTLGKFALGLSDNFLTCLFRAWDFSRPVILAPAMNTLMWDSPVTRRHFRLLLEDHGDGRHGQDWTLEDAPGVFERHAPGIVLVPPQAKRLACGDVGLGGIAEVDTLMAAVRSCIDPDRPPSVVSVV